MNYTMGIVQVLFLWTRTVMRNSKTQNFMYVHIKHGSVACILKNTQKQENNDDIKKSTAV